MSSPVVQDYGYDHPDHGHAHRYLYGPVLAILRSADVGSLLDVGCGNGSIASALVGEGFDAVGVDVSSSGIEIARRRHPDRFRIGSVYDDLRNMFPDRVEFDAILAMEVVEHLYAPASFADRTIEALRPGGLLVMTTPYHGYLKNLALAVTGRLDAHFTALWEGGHIKFWSRRTLHQLLRRAGFVDIRFTGAGRLPYLWKSMVVTARKPEPRSSGAEPDQQMSDDRAS